MEQSHQGDKTHRASIGRRHNFCRRPQKEAGRQVRNEPPTFGNHNGSPEKTVWSQGPLAILSKRLNGKHFWETARICSLNGADPTL